MRILFMGSRPLSVHARDLMVEATGVIGDDELDIVTTSDDSPGRCCSVVSFWRLGCGYLSAWLDHFEHSVVDHFVCPQLIISVFHNHMIPGALTDSAKYGAGSLRFGYLPSFEFVPDTGSPRQGRGDSWIRGTYRGSNVLSHCVLIPEAWHAHAPQSLIASISGQRSPIDGIHQLKPVPHGTRSLRVNEPDVRYLHTGHQQSTPTPKLSQRQRLATFSPDNSIVISAVRATCIDPYHVDVVVATLLYKMEGSLTSRSLFKHETLHHW
jgi:hypothetical protein